MNKADSKGFFEISLENGITTLKATPKFGEFMTFLKWNRYMPINGKFEDLTKESLDRYYDEFMKEYKEN